MRPLLWNMCFTCHRWCSTLHETRLTNHGKRCSFCRTCSWLERHGGVLEFVERCIELIDCRMWRMFVKQVLILYDSTKARFIVDRYCLMNFIICSIMFESAVCVLLMSSSLWTAIDFAQCFEPDLHQKNLWVICEAILQKCFEVEHLKMPENTHPCLLFWRILRMHLIDLVT